MAIATAAASASPPRQTPRRSSSATARTARACLVRRSEQYFQYRPRTSLLQVTQRSMSKPRRAAIDALKRSAESAERPFTPLRPMRPPCMACDSDALMNVLSLSQQSRSGPPPLCLGSMTWHHSLVYQGSSLAPHRAMTPNPSLKRSVNGRPPGPVWRHTVHFRQPGPGVLPLSPA
jgi:hypothetical protein